MQKIGLQKVRWLGLLFT